MIHGNLNKTCYCESYIRNETQNIRGALQSWSLNGTDFTPVLSQTLTYGAEVGSSDWIGRITTKSTIMANSVSNPNPYGRVYSVKYDYHYSKGGFLDQANFIDNSSTNIDYSTSYNYDRQGNLTNIVRYGKYFEDEYLDLYSMDIERSGNLISDIIVDDFGSVPMESQPIPMESEFSFKYDSNGNRTADPTRGIDKITWNWNNKPTSIWFGDAESLHYTHSVSGDRITSKYSIYGDEEDIIETRSNINSFEYKNRKFNRRHYRNFYTDSIGARHLMVPDYQGNIIAVINLETNKIEQFTDYYPYGLPHASSVSPQSNRYKFGAKELTTEGGAYLANFEARLQSPFLGDFLSPDPKAEDYLSLSPWSFCAGDPVNFIDPTGKDWLMVCGDRVYWYGGKYGDTSVLKNTYKSTSGAKTATLIINGKKTKIVPQNSKYQHLKNCGPTVEGKYKLNLAPKPETAKIRKGNIESGKGKGIQLLNNMPDENGNYFYSPMWGNYRINFIPVQVSQPKDENGVTYSRDLNSFYFHDSTKGETHGCHEIETKFFEDLLKYQEEGNVTIFIKVYYPNSNHNTNGGTEKQENE